MTSQPHNPQSTDTQDELRSELFEVLNCYEVDASEVSDGMTYIGSNEASKILDKLMPLINFQALKLLDRLESKLDWAATMYPDGADREMFGAIPFSALQEERKRYGNPNQ